ncbi:MAG: dihydropteroate synthase [Candidatus Lokiarchaeota archaeon]|nr:dihydropteroate synthase [Candidatus Lokiarchaeota archaeon]
MKKIYMNLHGILEIGDDCPTVIMGVLNLSPESFYQGSVYSDDQSLEKATRKMIENGVTMLDLGARSTAPWSQKITIDEEINRIQSAMELVCNIIPKEVIISVDTQYTEVAEVALKISLKFEKKIIINDVSCLKTDSTLEDFLIKHNLPVILIASKELPGDLCEIAEILHEFSKTIKHLKSKGYNENLIIIDPGIGKWVEKKVHTYDLKIINNLGKLRILNLPILIAISRKSFIGTTLNIPDPENRLNGTLSSTAIAVYNGAHIVRTHDVDNQIFEIVKMAKEIRRNK